MSVYFFKCSFIKRVWSVIFELDEVSISNMVKFLFQRITLKIEGVFREKQKTFWVKNWPKGLLTYLPKRTTTNAKFLKWGESHFFRCNPLNGCISRNRIFTYSLTHWRALTYLRNPVKGLHSNFFHQNGLRHA